MLKKDSSSDRDRFVWRSTKLPDIIQSLKTNWVHKIRQDTVGCELKNKLNFCILVYPELIKKENDIEML